MNKPNKIVEVIWLDAGTEQGWQEPDEIIRKVDVGLECSTVGYLLCETDKTITVVQGLSYDENYDVDYIAEATTIPKVCVLKVKELGVP